ncbi:hypothetical protein [Salibacter halophilus]|uniref:Uncharacterized protein n=1 Tax=Salibacter halophilus TaxID=1803916 RepID=A0A6N6M841_9FLAO|nr:hypothetical protein [Salibacter halophilus]KAB1064083.1 hypothetical protein F3059_08615 [Salibacter halophilus]
MKKGIFILLVAVITACSSPLDRTYTEESSKEDFKVLSKELDSSDKKLLIGTVMRKAFQQESIEGMTYREILEEGKEWKRKQEEKEAEQKAMAEKAAREEAERIERLQNAVMVSCFDKGFYEAQYEEFLTYGFAIKNKSDKDIRAVKGAVVFNDVFDEEIYSLNLTYDQPIKSGEQIKWNAQSDYNQFTDEHQRLKNKELKDIKVVWKPEKVIFTDGTILE